MTWICNAARSGVRGEVIDIHPAESDKEAIRIELFDDEIENLSYFDPLTGEVLRRVPRLTVYPKTHYVTPREVLLAAVEHIKVELKDRLNTLRDNDRLVEAQRLEQRTQYDIEMIMETGYCSGIENYSRYLSKRPAGSPPPCLFDYLPKKCHRVCGRIARHHSAIWRDVQRRPFPQGNAGGIRFSVAFRTG